MHIIPKNMHYLTLNSKFQNGHMRFAIQYSQFIFSTGLQFSFRKQNPNIILQVIFQRLQLNYILNFIKICAVRRICKNE